MNRLIVPFNLTIPVNFEYLQNTSTRKPIIRKRILREAYKIAQKAKSDFRHGAIIFDGNKIMSKGFNIPTKTHPNGSGRYTSIHAEVMAITNALKIRTSLNKLNILIIRLNNQKQFLLSKPCKDCMNLINRLGLNPIWSY